MKPLSIRKRRYYLVLFAVIFCLCIPLLILYATGYRFTSALDLIRTGGFYISVPQSDAQVHIGNSIVRQTNIFQRNIFVQDLRQGSYNLSVEKNGFQTWSKRLSVFPQTVTEAHAFLLPDTVLLIPVPALISSENDTAGTTTGSGNLVRNLQFQTVTALFAPVIQTPASTSTAAKFKGKLSVKNVKGVLHADWLGDIDSIPYYFCVNGVCKNDIVIATPSAVRSFDFYPGRDDLLVVAIAGGIYVSEIDDRSTQNIEVVMKGKNLDFRVSDDESLYIKNGTQLYLASL